MVVKELKTYSFFSLSKTIPGSDSRFFLTIGTGTAWIDSSFVGTRIGTVFERFRTGSRVPENFAHLFITSTVDDLV